MADELEDKLPSCSGHGKNEPDCFACKQIRAVAIAALEWAAANIRSGRDFELLRAQIAKLKGASGSHYPKRVSGAKSE